MKTKLFRSLLASALALAALPAVAQNANSPFTQTVFFGDSLTDAGFFRPLLPASSQAVTGQFTTNPGYVWAQYLADFYGTNASSAWVATGSQTPPFTASRSGTNYAVGGSRVATDYAGGLGFTPSISTQVNAYLAANGGRADPNALYAVWGGANDLFFASAQYSAILGNNGTQAQAQAAVQATIGAAVTADIGLISRLASAGAQYILVPTIPDFGKTPQYLTNAMTQAFGTSLSSSYNTALFNGLASANLRVIPLDTFHFLQEVIANPTLYGITNTTGKACLTQPAPAGGSSLFCNPLSTVPGGANSYLFADDVHPTSGAHKALADFAIAMIEGPRQIAILPHSAQMVGRGRAQMIDGTVSSMMRQDGDGMQWWASVRGEQQRYGAPYHFDGMGPTASFGVGWRSGNLTYGGFAGYGRQDIDFGLRRGDFRQTDAGLGAFLGWSSGAMWMNAQLSWTNLDFDVHRAVNLGPATRVHSGSPGGDNLSLGATAGWNFAHGALTHGPVVSLLAQKISVDGYSEDSTMSTALAFPEQNGDSLIGSLGWQVEYAINDHLKPYARATYDREFEDSAEQAFAQSLSMAGTLPYAVPGLGFDESYGTLTFGVRSEVLGLDVTTGSSLTVGQKGGNDSSFFLTVGSKF